MSNQKANKQARLAIIREAKSKSVERGTKLNEKALTKRIKPAAVSIDKAEKKAKAAMDKRTKLLDMIQHGDAGAKQSARAELKRINTHWNGAKSNLGDFYRPDRRTKTVTARG